MKKLSLLILTGLLSCNISASEKGANYSYQPAVTDTIITKAKLAHSMAETARDTQDPLLMAAAAKLLATLPTQDADHGEKSEEGTGQEGDEKKSENVSLFDEARALAKGDKVTVAVITQAEQQVMGTTKGRVGGPGRTVERVRSGRTDAYNISFRGNQQAEVLISGDGDTDLDLFIYDEYGNEICRSVSSDDDEYCAWYPRFTGPFSVKIKNLGSVYNEYHMFTN